MVTFKKPHLLLIKSWTFSIWKAFLCHHINEL